MKIKLRSLEMKDLDNVMSWINDKEVVKNFSNFDHKFTKEEEKEFLINTIKNKDEKVFSILKEDGEYIGQVGIHQIYWKAKLGRLSIVIGNKKYQGKGIAQEAINEILKIAFEEMKLHKIWAITFSTNIRMQHILGKIGFKIEGVLREEYILNDEYHDVVRYSILEKEYKKIRKMEK